MNRKIKFHGLVTVVSYLLVSFVKWDIFWISEINHYLPSERVVMILCVFLIHLITDMILSSNPTKKQ